MLYGNFNSNRNKILIYSLIIYFLCNFTFKKKWEENLVSLRKEKKQHLFNDNREKVRMPSHLEQLKLVNL